MYNLKSPFSRGTGSHGSPVMAHTPSPDSNSHFATGGNGLYEALEMLAICRSVPGRPTELLAVTSMVYGRFPESHFPGKTFPGKTFPGKSFSWKK